MTIDHKHWEQELQRIEQMVPQRIASASIPPSGIVGVAVDDDAKRDYFIPRLQQMLDDHQWSITFRVITVVGGLRATDLRANKEEA